MFDRSGFARRLEIPVAVLVAVVLLSLDFTTLWPWVGIVAIGLAVVVWAILDGRRGRGGPAHAT